MKVRVVLAVLLSYLPVMGSPEGGYVDRFPAHRAYFPVPSAMRTECQPGSTSRGHELTFCERQTWARSKTRCSAFARITSENRNRQFSEIVLALKMNRISRRSAELAVVPTRPSVLRSMGNVFSRMSAASIF